MATANITGGTADGRLRKMVAEASGWAACLADTPDVDTTSTTASLHHSHTSGYYYCDRLYFTFDVSPYAGYTITAASIDTYDDSAGTADSGYYFALYYYDWGTSLTTADWATLGTAASDPIAWPSYAVGARNIPLINLSNILTSNGRFVMAMTSESTEPTGSNRTTLGMADHATESYRPVLNITYSGVVAPTISASQVSSDIVVDWS